MGQSSEGQRVSSLTDILETTADLVEQTEPDAVADEYGRARQQAVRLRDLLTGLIIMSEGPSVQDWMER